MPSLSETVTKKASFPMWVGGEGDLERLFALIERPFERFIEEHVEERVSLVRWRVESAERDVELAEDYLASVHPSDDGTYERNKVAIAQNELAKARLRVEAEASEARLGGRLRLTVSTDDRETRRTTGTAQELAEYLRGRTYREFEIEAPSGSIQKHGIVVTADVSDGLRIRVNSTDALWATATFADLESAARAKVPTWHGIRAAGALYAIFVAVMTVVGIGLSQPLFGWLAPDGTLDWVTGISLAIGWGLVTMIVAFAATEFTRKRVPAFEVVAPGEKSKGRALIGIVVGAVITVVLGVLTNVLSSAVAS